MNRAVVFACWLGVAGSLSFCHSARAANGAAVPWTTYEAESMSISGGFILGPSYAPNLVQSESSGRRCVRLNSTGAYAEFTAQAAANSLVVRYSVPDAAGGGGNDYTLSLYKNGTLIAKLPLTSKYSWLYGAYPFVNNPASGATRNFFDETRTNNLTISLGDVIRLQKDAGDGASFYDIDLVDLENVPAALSQPGGSVSVKSAPYNAAGDGVTDDTSAFQNCINANSSVWIPAGNYKITGSLSLPANRTIRGAGMWHSTLVGDPTLYSTSNRRITLNGSGSNIQLSDLAIVGKLNYRNDSEPNDGIGGNYGTGSTISRLWVEHTKAGAWVVNSSGLVVDGCRFRNTIADGINLVVGMRSSTVTNCTARGTGDDCFAIWPATYLSRVYVPGLNVVTHCTGQMPWLANGGAIYGGDSNRIEDCLFQDTTYGCGILFSTTFTVSHTFSGTTIAQRSDLNRCGGYDPGLTWRAAVQFFLQNTGITGVNLNNLMITNSASDGMSVADNGGPLSNAIISNVSIPNYGLGVSGRHGLWARSDAIGSMTVSNSSIVEFANDSSNFTFNFVTSTIPVTVQTSPSGRSFTVDGNSYSSTQIFNWVAGSSHTISTTSTQSGGAGVQYVWNSWSDGGAVSHTVAPGSATTYTANFTTQYFLTMIASSGGSVTPASSWNNSGANVNISATPSNAWSFGGWTGSGSGSYSGSSSSTSITMNGPITETTAFVSNILVTVQPSPSGRSFSVDGTNYTSSQVFSWVPGSSHTIATTSPQSGGAGVQFLWNSWSDGGAISHTLNPASNSTFTANFTTLYYLTMNPAPGGSVSPTSGWNDGGAIVNISAAASNGYSFVAWTGTGSGSYSGPNISTSITMNGPITETATFVTNILLSVETRPTGRSFTVDGSDYVTNQTFSWVPGSSHTIATTSPQSGAEGEQFVWNAWTDGGALSHAIAPTSNLTYMANFTLQYYLTMNSAPGGNVSPASGWHDSGTNLNINATSSSGYTFSSWSGSGTGSYSGSNNPASVTVNGPLTQSASFDVITNSGPSSQSILGITVGESVTLTYATTSGFSYHVEVTTNLFPAFWTTVPGSTTNASGTTVTFTYPLPSGDGPLFYRTVSP